MVRRHPQGCSRDENSFYVETFDSDGGIRRVWSCDTEEESFALHVLAACEDLSSFEGMSYDAEKKEWKEGPFAMAVKRTPSKTSQDEMLEILARYGWGSLPAPKPAPLEGTLRLKNSDIHPRDAASLSSSLSIVAPSGIELERFRETLRAVRHEGWSQSGWGFASCAACGARLGIQRCYAGCKIDQLLGPGGCGPGCLHDPENPSPSFYSEFARKHDLRFLISILRCNVEPVAAQSIGAGRMYPAQLAMAAKVWGEEVEHEAICGPLRELLQHPDERVREGARQGLAARAPGGGLR